MRVAVLFIFILLSYMPPAFAEVKSTHPATNQIAWQPYSDAIFARAKAEQRSIFLFAKASWCEWGYG